MSAAIAMHQANKQMAISKRRLGKNSPAETNTHVTKEGCF
jgi:hypothetical protein